MCVKRRLWGGMCRCWCLYQMKVIRVRVLLICHTLSSSYSWSAALNWAGVKPRDTHRCSASAMRTARTFPPSDTNSRTREKITSAGRWDLDTQTQTNQKPAMKPNYCWAAMRKSKVFCCIKPHENVFDKCLVQLSWLKKKKKVRTHIKYYTDVYATHNS